MSVTIPGTVPGMEAGLSRGPFRAPRGTEISCKGWQQEAALRMLLNNLDRRWRRSRKIWWCMAGREKRRGIGMFSCDCAFTEGAGGGRDAAGAIGQAGGGVSNA